MEYEVTWAPIEWVRPLKASGELLTLWITLHHCVAHPSTAFVGELRSLL